VVKELATELEALNIVHIFESLDHGGHPLLEPGSLCQDLVKVWEESRQVELEVPHSLLHCSLSDLGDLALANGFHTNFVLQAHLELHVGIILDDPGLLRDETANTPFYLGGALMVDTIAEVHG
jgi:hypothetical protein